MPSQDLPSPLSVHEPSCEPIRRSNVSSEPIVGGTSGHSAGAKTLGFAWWLWLGTSVHAGVRKTASRGAAASALRVNNDPMWRLRNCRGLAPLHCRRRLCKRSRERPGEPGVIRVGHGHRPPVASCIEQDHGSALRRGSARSRPEVRAILSRSKRPQR